MEIRMDLNSLREVYAAKKSGNNINFEVNKTSVKYNNKAAYILKKKTTTKNKRVYCFR